jgi:hypothetical protein
MSTPRLDRLERRLLTRVVRTELRAAAASEGVLPAFLAAELRSGARRLLTDPDAADAQAFWRAVAQAEADWLPIVRAMAAL